MSLAARDISEEKSVGKDQGIPKSMSTIDGKTAYGSHVEGD
jgi:hypothetical protein